MVTNMVIKAGSVPAIPQRALVGLMIFFGTFFTYMLRVNISIAIIPMIAANRPHGNYTDESMLDSMTFDWSPATQGIILGAYFWGYIITSLPGGMLAERYGPRHVVTWTMLLSAVLTILHPFAAAWDSGALIALRVAVGFLGGVQFPSFHVLVARWSPPHERGKFTACLIGGAIGTVVCWSLCGVIIANLNWECTFYVLGALCILWVASWFYIVADSPSCHPRIDEKEAAYINECVGSHVRKSKAIPPFKNIATSLPFFCMLVLHFGNMWGHGFITSAAPKFMSTVLGFNIGATGILSGMPYLARFFLSILFGLVADGIMSKKWMSTVAIRKFFCVFSHIIPGILLVLIGYVGRSPPAAVALMTMSMGINGAAVVTNLQNHQDLSPNFAGTLYGIANLIGATPGFITPMVTAYFTRYENGFDQWQYIFIVGASLYIAPALFFMAFGSASVQPWNAVPASETDKESSIPSWNTVPASETDKESSVQTWNAVPASEADKESNEKYHIKM